MKRFFAIISVAALVGCGPQSVLEDPSKPDQCMRREIFLQCMAALPKGPTSVVSSNDWDEVVSSCANTAYYQSIRKPAQIKPECMP